MFLFYSTWITRMNRIENENGKQTAMEEAEAIFGTPDFAPFRKRVCHPGMPIHPESTGTSSRRGFLVRIRGNADSGLPGRG
jgi:hypothetical protein